MTRALMALIGVAVLLAAILVNEWIAGPDDTIQVAALTLPGPAPTGKDSVDHSAADLATILARPLFSEGRRGTAAPAIISQGPVAGLPRLTGVLITPEARRAIFAGALGSRGIVVAEGGQIDRYVVAKIGEEDVLISGPDGTHQLRPSYANGAALFPGPGAPTAPIGALPPIIIQAAPR